MEKGRLEAFSDGVLAVLMISPVIHLVAIASAFFEPIVACVLYAVVALIWIVPDRRIERHAMPNL